MRNLIRKFLWVVLVLPFGFLGCNDDKSQSSVTTPAQPAIAAISPNQISKSQKNAEIRIQGSNLTGVTTVSFGDGIAVQSFSSPSASEVVVVVTASANAAAGTRNVTVTTSGGTASNAALFSVINNAVPLPKFTMSTSKGTTSAPVEFDASASSDDERVATYSWDFGDGSSNHGKKVSHQYKALGTLRVILTLTDDKQGSASASRQIEIIKNKLPVARWTVTPGTGTVNTTYTFDSSNSTDPDGRIVDYIWKFDGGATRNGMVVTYQFSSDGEHAVELTVEDNLGSTAVLEKDVSVDKAPQQRGCPPPAQLQGGKCCYKGRCCSEKSVQKGSIGWCSGKIICTSGKSGYQPPLPGFENYPGKSCSEFPY